MSLEADPAWHESYYGEGWQRASLHFADLPTRSEVDLVEHALHLVPRMHVLDMPCGHGRHSLELGSRGMKVTGIDASPESIAIATDRARRRSLRATVRFVHGDMRTATTDEPADAAIIMQSSFGFMATEDEDRQVLANIRRSLVPDGKLLVDMVSVFRLARTMIVPRRWERLDDGTVHIEDRDFDFAAGRRITKVELFTPSGEHFSMTSTVRIYTLPEFGKLMDSAGYQIVETFGGYDRQPFSFDASRLIIVAQRVD